MSRLEKLVAEVLGLGEHEVDDTTGAGTTAEWTSLRHLQIVAAVGKEYGLRLTAKEARACRNVGDLRALLEKKGQAA